MLWVGSISKSSRHRLARATHLDIHLQADKMLNKPFEIFGFRLNLNGFPQARHESSPNIILANTSRFSTQSTSVASRLFVFFHRVLRSFLFLLIYFDVAF